MTSHRTWTLVVSENTPSLFKKHAIGLNHFIPHTDLGTTRAHLERALHAARDQWQGIVRATMRRVARVDLKVHAVPESLRDYLNEEFRVIEGIEAEETGHLSPALLENLIAGVTELGERTYYLESVCVPKQFP